MPSASYEPLLGEAAGNTKAAHVARRSSSRSARIFCRLSLTILLLVAIFLIFSLLILFLGTPFLAVPLDSFPWLTLALTVSVFVVFFIAGHRILGRFLKSVIIHGTQRVLADTHVDIGQLRVSPCAGELVLKNAGVCQPPGFNSSSQNGEKYMLEVKSLNCELNLCALMGSVVRNKVKGTELVIELNHFLLESMMIHLDLKLNGESNLKKLYDNIQDTQRKIFGPSSQDGTGKKRTTAMHRKIILHKVDVLGLRLCLSSVGVSTVSLVLPDIKYIDFVAEVEKTDEAEIALELAGRVLKLTMEALVAQTTANVKSVSPSVNTMFEAAVRAEEEAWRISANASKTLTETVAKTVQGTKQTSAMLVEASRHMQGVKGIVGQVAHKAEGLVDVHQLGPELVSSFSADTFEQLDASKALRRQLREREYQLAGVRELRTPPEELPLAPETVIGEAAQAASLPRGQGSLAETRLRDKEMFTNAAKHGTLQEKVCQCPASTKKFEADKLATPTGSPASFGPPTAWRPAGAAEASFFHTSQGFSEPSEGKSILEKVPQLIRREGDVLVQSSDWEAFPEHAVNMREGAKQTRAMLGKAGKQIIGDAQDWMTQMNHKAESTTFLRSSGTSSASLCMPDGWSSDAASKGTAMPITPSVSHIDSSPRVSQMSPTSRASADTQPSSVVNGAAFWDSVEKSSSVFFESLGHESSKSRHPSSQQTEPKGSARTTVQADWKNWWDSTAPRANRAGSDE